MTATPAASPNTAHSASDRPAVPVWPAPRATAPIDATVDVPGSKSLTNRQLLLGAIASEPSVVRGALASRDADLMVGALRALGADITVTDLAPGVQNVAITPAPLHGGSVDVGLAGTVMRFVPAIAVTADGDVHMDGNERARERPIGPVVDALRRLGAQIDAATDKNGAACLPLAIRGKGSFAGGPVTIDASGSSQFVSALLLGAPAWENGVEIRHEGPPVPSLPHVEMTVGVLRERGVVVHWDANAQVENPSHASWRVEPGPVAGGEITVEPDLSNAGVFLAAAMLTGGTVRIPRTPQRTLQPLADVHRVFEQLGGKISVADGVLTITGPGAADLRPIEADLGRIGELTPTIAAMCAVAPGDSRLSGIAHLRTHETDRLAAISREITRLGGTCVETRDGLFIEGTPPEYMRGAEMETYADHRMATFAALLGLVVDDVTVRDVATTDKTLPNFTERWAALLDGR